MDSIFIESLSLSLTAFVLGGYFTECYGYMKHLRRIYYRVFYFFKRPLTRDAKVERQALESAAIVCERMAWTHRSSTVVLYEAARRIRRLHGETVDANFSSQELASPSNRKG